MMLHSSSEFRSSRANSMAPFSTDFRSSSAINARSLPEGMASDATDSAFRAASMHCAVLGRLEARARGSVPFGQARLHERGGVQIITFPRTSNHLQSG